MKCLLLITAKEDSHMQELEDRLLNKSQEAFILAIEYIINLQSNIELKVLVYLFVMPGN